MWVPRHFRVDEPRVTDRLGISGAYTQILDGTDAGRAVWAQRVLDRAEETGLSLDADGNVVEAATADP